MFFLVVNPKLMSFGGSGKWIRQSVFARTPGSEPFCELLAEEALHPIAHDPAAKY